MHGSHPLLHYSRIQAGVAYSSAEAEMYAALKMGCEILGMSQVCSEFGYIMKTTIHGDSSAVKYILARRGCGKVKHLEVKQLWLQEQVRSGKVQFQKISRKNNPSDALTHHYTRRKQSSTSITWALSSCQRPAKLSEGKKKPHARACWGAHPLQ